MHVVFSLQPGGMEFGVVKLVNGLDPSRVQSAICSTQPSGALKQLVRPEVPVFDLNRRNGNDIRVVWELMRLFRRERPDVVHTHGWGTLLEGVVAARLAGVRSVVHGEHGTLQSKSYQRWLQRRAWSSVDRVLSVSSRLADRMAAEMAFEVTRITTIRNGVDLSRFGSTDRAAARAALSVAADSSVFGTVGRLVPVKDHALLIDAAARLKQTGLNATLLISGDGPLRESLVAQVEASGLHNQVRFLGHRKDVEIVLAALDVFVLSSISEGLSNTILEAMATGLPVVATRVGGADELVVDGTTGLLVAPSSSGELTAALDRLFRSTRERHAMGAAGRARAEEHFALRVMIDKYEALYMDLARRTSRGLASGQAHNTEHPHIMRREYR